MPTVCYKRRVYNVCSSRCVYQRLVAPQVWRMGTAHFPLMLVVVAGAMWGVPAPRPPLRAICVLLRCLATGCGITRRVLALFAPVAAQYCGDVASQQHCEHSVAAAAQAAGVCLGRIASCFTVWFDLVFWWIDLVLWWNVGVCG